MAVGEAVGVTDGDSESVGVTDGVTLDVGVRDAVLVALPDTEALGDSLCVREALPDADWVTLSVVEPLGDAVPRVDADALLVAMDADGVAVRTPDVVAVLAADAAAVVDTLADSLAVAEPLNEPLRVRLPVSLRVTLAKLVGVVLALALPHRDGNGEGFALTLTSALVADAAALADARDALVLDDCVGVTRAVLLKADERVEDGGSDCDLDGCELTEGEPEFAAGVALA